jgi:alcohol dehydrogenase class IV
VDAVSSALSTTFFHHQEGGHVSGFRPERPETVFTYGAPGLKFGVGARHELAFDLGQLGARRVLVVTDPGVAATGAPDEVADALRADGVEAVVFDRARVEPTDASMVEAIEFARSEGPFDAIVAIGGGSSIDTAKAVNLLVTNDGDLMDYVNAPVGRAQAPTNPLLPLVAVPTTTGTGSESTTICVLDVLAQHVKTGISHPRLRPTLAVVDPELTITQPAGVTAAAGLDILCHALESYTARPFASYEHKRADERVPYCGSNPIADMWSEQALVLMSGAFRTAVHDGKDLEARTQVAMAATFAGLGFGNAGVHIPHANAYPIAGQVRDFRPEGYDADHAMVPHGMAVALTAPAAFGFTFEAAPERHVRAAELLSQGSTDAWAERPDDPADHLPRVLTGLMREVGIPSGLAAVGYGAGDIDALVEGTMKQQRLLATAPREVTEDDVARILDESIELW